MKRNTVFMLWLFLYGAVYWFGETMSPILGIRHAVTVFSMILYWIFLFAYLRTHGALKQYFLCVPENRKISHYLTCAPLLLMPLINAAAAAGRNTGTESAIPDMRTVFHLLTAAFLSVSCVIGEEVLFRGILLSVFINRCALREPAAIAATSCMFAAMHLLNTASGAPLPYTLLQSVNAASMGVCLAVLSIREHSIIPGIVIHSLTNLTSFCPERPETFDAMTDSAFFTNPELNIFIVCPLLYLLWGIYLYQNKKGWKQL